MESSLKVILTPKVPAHGLPRGVFPHHEFRVYDHEREQWVLYREFRLEVATGVGYITVREGQDLNSGIQMALSLLRDDRATVSVQGNVRGVVNSLKNHEDLMSGAPLAFALSRGGAYTERSVRRLLDILMGGAANPSKLYRAMVDRPGLIFPYHPYANAYCRVKPGYIPPEIKMKYATPLGTQQNELFLAGKVLNNWSAEFHARVQQDVSYPLWITEGEKKSWCLSLLPMLLGVKMDVVGIPGVWMWGKKKGDAWDLAPELASYRWVAGPLHRMVGIFFDQDSWRNPKVADALLRLVQVLREQGALVFVAVIPPGHKQKGVDDFFIKHCLQPEGFDFEPLVSLMQRSIFVSRDYKVNYPPPEQNYKLKFLAERAEQFEAVKEQCNGKFFDLSPVLVDQIVSQIGMAIDAQGSDLNGEQYLKSFRALTAERQEEHWVRWVDRNPFQLELDRRLDYYIPGVFRGRAAADPLVTWSEVQKKFDYLALSDLNHY